MLNNFLVRLFSFGARRSALVLIVTTSCGIIPPLAAQSDLSLIQALRVPVPRIPNARPELLPFDLRHGIGPDEAALLAVYWNRALRSARARRGLAVAQVVQAGVLPNPQVNYTRDYVTGGNTFGTQTAHSLNAGWEVTSLLPLIPREIAARTNLRSVDLDLAWAEWQTAENARTAVYRVVGLRAELASAQEAERELSKSADTLQRAMEAHEKTVLDFGAAKAAQQDALAISLGLEQETNRQVLVLKKAVGIPAETEVRLRDGIGLPAHLEVPDERGLTSDLENRRLDLVALQQGYRSQDATVRAAILGAFPKIALGFAKTTDTTNVQTEGFAITVDVPLFDRHQGVIAIERATRQRLRDEYDQRVFEADIDIASALADVRSLNKQIAAAEEALPVFERLVNAADAALREGNTDVLAAYSARSGLLQRRIGLIKLKEQLLEARTALELASGRFIPSNAAMHLK